MSEEVYYKKITAFTCNSIVLLGKETAYFEWETCEKSYIKPGDFYKGGFVEFSPRILSASKFADMDTCYTIGDGFPVLKGSISNKPIFVVINTKKGYTIKRLKTKISFDLSKFKILNGEILE